MTGKGPATTPREVFQRWRASGGPGDREPDARSVERGIELGWEAAMKLVGSQAGLHSGTDSPFETPVTVQVAGRAHQIRWPPRTLLMVMLLGQRYVTLWIAEELVRESPAAVADVVGRHLADL